MLTRIFNGVTMTGLEKSMEASKLRDAVISHNIANEDTPNFNRSYVEFEQYMHNALLSQSDASRRMKRTRTGHIEPQAWSLDGVAAQVKTDYASTLRLDGNNVDIEHEQAERAKNEVHYKMLVEQMNSEFRRVRIAMGK